ncbi:uncharacterized protein LOC131054608 [Cryptomeria japonica]|uniref:uncharacterized protein LOC131054608 n=1 Tax=Cryptomeria japonica TaxID=3369 RepID=UPI0027DA43E0|nr:uncharacterized protein LOC131054608 [Cryptomeria japonica]
MSENLHNPSSGAPNSVTVASNIKYFQSVVVQNSGLNGGNARIQSLPEKEYGNPRFGEVAGGTTAECAAVICCPCALLNLAVLAFVRLPVSLLKRACKKARRKRRKGIKAVQGRVTHYEDSDTEDSSLASSQDELLSPIHKLNSLVMDRPYVSTEKFWEDVVGKSYVGFWRNHSTRE